LDGTGTTPAWIADVKDRTKYLIKSAADVAVSTAASAGSNAKTAVKKASTTDEHRGQRTGPQPAKYLDLKSGATWSGRGPAPAWLAGAKDRSKFLIAGAGAVATDTSTASNASKPKAVAKSGAVAKKGAAKRVATSSKEVAAKKVATPSAKRAVVKKVAGKKAAAVKTVAAKVDAPAVPNAPAEVSA
jgi:DNA-binding protein H-NS